jgi:hypothetical protein
MIIGAFFLNPGLPVEFFFSISATNGWTRPAGAVQPEAWQGVVAPTPIAQSLSQPEPLVELLQLARTAPW